MGGARPSRTGKTLTPRVDRVAPSAGSSDTREDCAGQLTIDLGALAGNWHTLRAQARDAECAAVVKADGYGLGLEPVVETLARAGCQTFFVAHLSEAVRARRTAPGAILYVLNGLLPGTAPAYRDHDLRPVIGSPEELQDWSGAGPFALHVDTGMNRLGFMAHEAGGLAATVRPALLMTHFVSSEEPAATINASQIEVFEAVRASFPGVPASLSNSSGLFLPGRPLEDVVRPGFALYGGNPTPGRPNPMRPVVRLETPVIQVRDVPAGETVGYNATWSAPRPSRIATVCLGYADGYLRSGSATNETAGGAARINGRLCPVVGRVSMDLITLDVTAAGPVRRGDLASFIDEELTVDEVARHLGTNGYEVLTSLGGRFERRHAPLTAR
jgi:alanine racemase